LVTVVSVLLILLLVYRAPVAAVVPLLAISLGALVVFKLLAIAGQFGFHNGMAEQIFTFVLLYGAGVDYSLLFMSRYREFLDRGHVRQDAITAALDASVATIFSSAVMTIAGVGMLCFARFSVFHNAGPAVMLAVAMAAIVASTLVPAALAIAGRSAFWPAKDDAPKVHSGNSRPSLWPRIARVVVARPGWVMVITCLVLIPPALSAFAIDWNYDAIYSLKAGYPARQGEAIVERHWPVGEITPITVLSIADNAQSTETWRSVAAQLATDLRTVADIENIRCLSQPVGQAATATENAALLLLGGGKVISQYLSSDGMAMRMSVVLKVPPFSHRAMNDAAAITTAAQASLAKSHWQGRTYLTGATAEMVDIRAIT
jgi:RND superfamily putative drug exporter